VVANCQKRAVNFVMARSSLIKMCLSLISYKFSFVTHTDNCFGESLQLETLDQTNKVYRQLCSCWRVVGNTMSMFHIQRFVFHMQRCSTGAVHTVVSPCSRSIKEQWCLCTAVLHKHCTALSECVFVAWESQLARREIRKGGECAFRWWGRVKTALFFSFLHCKQLLFFSVHDNVRSDLLWVLVIV